jgi:hypothetical protein
MNNELDINEPTIATSAASARTSTPTAGPASGRRRAESGKRWSASSTIQWLDATGQTVRRDADASDRPAGAVKALVHYRLDKKPKRPTFYVRTSEELDALRAFTKTLELSYLANWPADHAGKPVPPTLLISSDGDAEANATAQHTSGIEDPQATPLVALSALTETEQRPRLTASRLVEIVRAHQRKTPKRRGGDKKKRNTQNNYDKTHDFFLEHARYQPGDPRLEILGLEPGDEWVFDDPAAPIRPADVLGLIAIRAATNLRSRGVNTRRLANWHKDLEAAQKRAGGEALQVPATPELVREEASARTIEAFGQQLGVLLEHAYRYEHMTYRLWTESIKDEVPHAGATSYTTRTVPSRREVGQIVDTIATITRSFRDRDGTYRTVNGERYAAMVWLAGREAPRPEENIAIRDSWVLLDPVDPRIVLHYAEIIQPSLDDLPRERVQTLLKHRAENEIRVLRPARQDREEFIAVLSEHRKKFVKKTAEDPDPYFFTTETGRPVDLSNFNDNWWAPTRDEVFGDHPHFANLPFRRLRAAAITDWLVTLGWSTGRAADKAGNSQAVLEKHYKGVLASRAQSDEDASDERQAGKSTALAGSPGGAVASAAAPADLTDGEIAAREAALRTEMAAARAEFEKLQALRLARFEAADL